MKIFERADLSKSGVTPSGYFLNRLMVLFMEEVHPTMNTKASSCWRTRINIVGTINLKSMEVKVMRFQTVNGDSIFEYFDFLKEKYPKKICGICFVLCCRSELHVR